MGHILIGVSSWSDRSLTHDSAWYPKRSMKAAERMAFYAQRFPIVEMETAFRFPPTPGVAQQWVDRTPPGFSFDIPAWSLLTQQPTIPSSLWQDLAQEVRPDRRDNPRLYAAHLSCDAYEEAWRRFVHALMPLADTGRLGTVLLRYPRWFVPRDSNREQLVTARAYLGDLPVAVELTHREWFAGDACEQTLALLEELKFGFVCVDETTSPSAPGAPCAPWAPWATTTDTAVVRLNGRRPTVEPVSHQGGSQADERAWAPDRRSYQYSDAELKGLLARIRHLAESSTSVHVLFGTAWRDDAVRNGESLQRFLGNDNWSLDPRARAGELRSTG